MTSMLLLKFFRCLRKSKKYEEFESSSKLHESRILHHNCDSTDNNEDNVDHKNAGKGNGNDKSIVVDYRNGENNDEGDAHSPSKCMHPLLISSCAFFRFAKTL